MWYVLIPLALLFLTERISTVANNPSYDDYFKKYAPIGIDWKLLKRIAKIESNIGLNPRVLAGAVSYDGLSYGLMQLRLTTAQDFDKSATIQKLNDPEYSVKIAALYINWCRNYLIKYAKLNQYDLRFTEFLVKSYNQGVGNTTKEINGLSKGFSQGYWEKYQKAIV